MHVCVDMGIEFVWPVKRLDCKPQGLDITRKGKVTNTSKKEGQKSKQQKQYRLDLLTLVTGCGDRSTLSHAEKQTAEANTLDERKGE